MEATAVGALHTEAGMNPESPMRHELHALAVCLSDLLPPLPPQVVRHVNLQAAQLLAQCPRDARREVAQWLDRLLERHGVPSYGVLGGTQPPEPPGPQPTAAPARPTVGDVSVHEASSLFSGPR